MRTLVPAVLFVGALLAQNADRFPGYRVVEGDMLLRPDSAITSEIPARLWTNNTVPYVIDPDIANPPRIMDNVTANLAAQVPNLSVVNGANFMRSPLSTGELVTIFGADIGPPQFAGAVLTAAGRFPTSLAGTTVMFNGMLAPIVYASANQTAVLVPYGLAGAATTGVSVTYNGSRTAGPIYNVDVSAPGIFTVKASGVGPAVVTNQDGTLNSADHPASKGSVIVLYATGEGQLSPGASMGRSQGHHCRSHAAGFTSYRRQARGVELRRRGSRRSFRRDAD